VCTLDPQGHADDIVTLFDADWVEDCLTDDWGLRKLSNYLRDPGLSLQQAIDTFQEVFTGA
jgi:type VI secretion system protein ImpM